MAPRCMTRSTFLKEYVFPTEPACDFELDGVQAKYASGHPKEWGTTEALDFGVDVKDAHKPTYQSYHSALSQDKKLLAISCYNEQILIYDIISKELRQVLEGAGSIAFRPRVDTHGSAENSSENTNSGIERAPYTIVSSISNNINRSGPKGNHLVLWDLDQHGRLLDEEEPIDPKTLAKTAIDAIAPELTAKHEWTQDFIDASALHAEFARALFQVATEHRRRHNTKFFNASLGSFGSTHFSSDGRLFLYHVHNRTTQHGMREPDELPQVVAYDIDAGKEVYRLLGHTDYIAWSAMSPNNQHFASVSWDGTLRMYSASTGELAWHTEDSGGQSWAGAFSPDSRFIVWSSNRGHQVQVLDVMTGRELSTLTEPFKNWCRCLEWHPSRHEVALCVGHHAYVWDVFSGSDGKGKIVQHFAVEYAIMVEINRVSWLDEGRLLCVETSEGTKLVYDTQTNSKELFQRPPGVDAAYTLGFYGLLQEREGNDIYLSVDGDGKVRYWRTSVPAYPSWWEKPKEPAVVAEKAPFPETGKYVKITKAASKEKGDTVSGETTESQ